MAKLKNSGESPAIKDPDEGKLGPAMLRLSAPRRRFVIAMLEDGGINATRAAKAAGYTDNPSNPAQLRVNAHRLAHDEDIQAAIREEALRALQAGTFVAVRTVLEIAADVTTKKKDRLKAAEMIMNRTGLHATSEHKVAVTHKDETTKEVMKQIEQLSKNLGLDPKQLLGGAVVDAEFEEVKPTEEDTLDDIY